MFFVWRDILNFSAEQQPSGFRDYIFAHVIQIEENLFFSDNVDLTMTIVMWHPGISFNLFEVKNRGYD